MSALVKNVPALIHCTGGKDRTGYIAAIIQLLVGVSYERTQMYLSRMTPAILAGVICLPLYCSFLVDFLEEPLFLEINITLTRNHWVLYYE
ncbi:tyrosine-protein phosphatase [Bacillus sp. JJ634]